MAQDSGHVAGAAPHPFAARSTIERHFESLHPRTRPGLGGAIPGSRLLNQSTRRRDLLSLRTRQSASPVPHATTTGTVLPGLELRPTQPGGVIPTSVVTGDFNGDGKPDYIVANGVTSDLWLYLGKGDGTFQLPRIIPLTKGLSPVYLVTASLRGNGKLDLVVAEFDTSTIGVLLGNGDGTFGYETDYSLPDAPAALTINDFDHDGKLDIAAVMVTTVDPATLGVPYIALLTGDGTGSFSAPVVTSNSGFYSTAQDLDSADVNHDGLPDLLITGSGVENSQVYLNNGDGTFKPGQTVIENGPFNLELGGRLADINEDGCPDAIVSDISGQVWISLGDCAGNFRTPTYISTGDSNAALRLADINGDGHLDILTAAYPGIGENEGEYLGMTAGNTMNVALGDGKGGFSVSRNYVGPGQSYSLATADFNGDGRADIVTANSDTDTTSVYLNDGSGCFGFPQGVFAGVTGQGVIDAPATSLSFTDLNNDGRPDLFFLDAGYSGEYYATSFLNDGTGRFSGPIQTDAGFNFVSNDLGDYRVAAIRGGTHKDLVAIGQSPAFSNAASFILFMPGNGDGTFGKPVLTPTPNADGSMTVGDFNGDGKLDLIAVGGTGTITLASFLGNGDGTFRTGSTLTFTDPNDDIGRVYTYDFNHDGKLDVLVFTTANGYWTTTSKVWEFDGNGDGTFQPGQQLFTDFQPLALADLNNDGKPDIARYDFFWPDGTTQTFGPAKFTNYLGQNDGSFQLLNSYAPYAGTPEPVKPFAELGDPLASSITGDFNGDGRPDEVAFQSANAAYYSQILMGNGDGSFTPTYNVYPTYIYGYPLYALDLDGDGFSDMVELDSGSSALHVIKGGPASTLQIVLADEVVTNNASCGYVFPNLTSLSARTVTFSSSISGVQLPASVSLPANATSVKFCYTLGLEFDPYQVFDVNATLEGDTATAYASDAYVEDFSEAIAPAMVPAIYGGDTSAPITVSLTSAAGFSSSVSLSCEGLPAGATCQFASSSLSLAGGASASTTVTVATTLTVGQNGDRLNFNIVASDTNVIHRQPVTIYIATLFAGFGGSYQVASPGTASGTVSVGGIPPYQLSCSGLPAGASCSFSGDQLPYPSNSSINVGISVTAGVEAASYPFTINITSGPQSIAQSNTLVVTAPVEFSLLPPTGSQDWALVGLSNQVINLPATLSGATMLNVTLSCSLDSGGTCIGGSATAVGTSSNLPVSVSIPAGTATGLHQLLVTATYQASGSQLSVTNNYSFPFYISDFSGSLGASSITLSAGTSSSVTFSLSATAGFTDTVSLSCTAASALTCAASPSSLQLTGGTPVTGTLTISNGSIASAADRTAGRPRAAHIEGAAFTLAAFFPCAIFFALRGRRRPRIGLMLLGLFALLPLASCGSGGGPASGNGGGNPGAGTYTLQVTAFIPGTTATRNLGTITVTVN